MNVVPTLGGDGFITDLSLQMKQLFINMFLTNASQSNLYKEGMISIPEIIARNPNDPRKITFDLNDAISAYYGRHFDRVEINVDYRDVEDSSDVIIDISIVVVHDGKVKHLKTALDTASSNILEYALNKLREG